MCKAILCLLFLAASVGARAQELNGQSGGSTKVEREGSSDIYLKVELDTKLKVSALKPGDAVEGKLLRDVYSRNRKLFPAGSAVRLTVDKLEQRRREPNDHWPWVVNAFTPRHEKYPAFQSAEVILPAGEIVPLRVSYLSMRHETELHAKPKSKKTIPIGADAGKGDPDLVTLLADGFRNIGGVRHTAPATYTANFAASLQNADPTSTILDESFANAHGETVTLPAGTRAKIILLGNVSASKSREGDVLAARLVEPVFYNSKVALPEGTILEGRVMRRTPPRMLSRSGSLMIAFTEVKGSQGVSETIEATIGGLEVDQRSHTSLDAEGGLRGERPGIGWTVINLAATAGIAKLTDDSLQLVIELIVASATDVSTAGTARIVAACVSGVFLLARHGRDVVLPKYTELEIVFDRPVTVPLNVQNSATR